MARGRTVPLLTQPVIVTLVCAELDALADSILADDGPHKSPLTEARAMLLRQIRTEIRDGAPLETTVSADPTDPQWSGEQ
jgi:hypothetical protein